ncbi:MAG: hypothetical protein ACRD22_13475 [Terriglobia bacterium]
MMSKKFAAACLLCALGGALACRAETASWPAAQPVQRTFDVPDVQKMNVLLLIHSEKGKPLYRLRCAHPGNEQDYSGDFECRLDTVESGDVGVGQTLLIEDVRQLKPWPSRGRFFAADLVGKCAAIPQFGATRDFRLRGMELTLQVLDPVVDTASQGFGGASDPQLRSLKLKVTVHPDPSATRAIAAIVPFPKYPPPQCGINPGAWPVGALGALGQPLKDISYFGDPATFTTGEPPTSVDWKSVPFSKRGEWNRDMQVGAKSSQCSAHFNTTATFHGTLIARRLLIHDRRLHTKSNSYIRDGTILKLDHPINICRQVAPNLATINAAAMAQGVSVSSTSIAAVRRSTNQMKGAFTTRVTSLFVYDTELSQLGAFNTIYIGHRVEITGSVSGYKDPQLTPFNLPGMIVDRICLLQEGKPTECSSDKRAL